MVRFLVGQEAEMGQELGLSYHLQSLPYQYLLSPNILYTQSDSTITHKQGHPMKKKSIETQKILENIFSYSIIANGINFT